MKPKHELGDVVVVGEKTGHVGNVAVDTSGVHYFVRFDDGSNGTHDEKDVEKKDAPAPTPPSPAPPDDRRD